MRGIRTAGVGLTLALSAIPALAQSPAATLGPIRVVETGTAPEATIRAQYTMPAPVRNPVYVQQPMPMTPMGGQPMPLGQPQPVPNPQVTELRDQNGQPIPYQATQGMMVPPPVLSAQGCDVTPQPTLVADPYLGNAVFPRLRGALASVPNSNRFSISAEYLRRSRASFR